MEQKQNSAAPQPVEAAQAVPEQDDVAEQAYFDRWANTCVGCEGAPAADNSPCGVCGKSAQLTDTTKGS